jgi:hypothetical protein
MSTAARRDARAADVTSAAARASRQSPLADSALLLTIAGQALAEMGVVEPSASLLRPIAETLADLVCTEPACSHD